MITVIPGNLLTGKIGRGFEFALPGDKSISHRAALLGAMAEGESVFDNFLVSGVTNVMLEALRECSVEWELKNQRLTIKGNGLVKKQKSTVVNRDWLNINCGNSGTTMRLLAGALPSMGHPAVLDGSAGLRKRPMLRVITPLVKMGVSIRDTDGCAPLYIDLVSKTIKGISYELPVASAQVKSCLLLAALTADKTTELVEPGPSRDHTERMLLEMGVILKNELIYDNREGEQTEEDFYRTIIHPPSAEKLLPLKMEIPGDISAASFLIVAALITPGSELSIFDIGLNRTRTGIIDVLMRMGADLIVDNQKKVGSELVGNLHIKSSKLNGTQVAGTDVVRMIDEFPIFAVAAANAEGITEVSDAQELRYKESDRISSLCQELKKIGIEVFEKPDGFRLMGGRPVGDTAIDPHHDHRLAMAFTVAGLASKKPIQIQNPQIINESFPDFLNILSYLGADINYQ